MLSKHLFCWLSFLMQIIEGLILYAIRHQNMEYELLKIKNTIGVFKSVLRLLSSDIKECVKHVIHRFNDSELCHWLRHYLIR